MGHVFVGARYGFFFFFLFLLAAPCCLWDLSSPARD